MRIAFTPAGKIIYSSPRGGAVDLWQMNADGGEQKQLTRNAGELNSQPRRYARRQNNRFRFDAIRQKSNLANGR